MTGRQSEGKWRMSGNILMVTGKLFAMTNGASTIFLFLMWYAKCPIIPHHSPPPTPDTQSSRKCWLVLLFFQICSWETSGGSFYGGNNFKTMFKTKQLLNMFKFWCKWGIRLVWWLATCTNRSHNQWSFKQWVGILLMTKIDRVCKNYLTPKIWEESHLRETFYGTLIFQQSSMICIGHHVGGHTLALPTWRPKLLSACILLNVW